MALTDTAPRILSPADLRRAIGVSRSTCWRMVRTGLLPAPVRVSEHRIGWHAGEIDAWLASRPRTTEQPARTAEDGK